MKKEDLFRKVVESKKPNLLKRKLSYTINNLLLTVKCIYDRNNLDIILCEPGIRAIKKVTKNTFNLNIAHLKQFPHLPILADLLEDSLVISRFSEQYRKVIVESHLNQCESLTDGHKVVSGSTFYQLTHELKPCVEAAGRTL
jgi:3-deoxy-7-phosphoheptulonate synthase